MRRWPRIWLLSAALTCGCQQVHDYSAPENAPVTLLPPAPLTADSHVNAVSLGSPYNTSAGGNVVATAATVAVPPLTQSTASPASTANRRFAHDPNYQWLVGSLDYSPIHRTWLLRYLSYEETDRYGGCVELVIPGETTNLHRGQIVHVEGSLIDPESRQMQPAYEVRNLRLQP